MKGYNKALTYTLINKSDGVTITCTQKYLANWLARGFEVISIDKVPYTMERGDRAKRTV